MSRAQSIIEALDISSLLMEGINDKNLFKAILLAGGPGSGKSFVVDQVIGKSGPVSALGAVVVSSDQFLEKKFKELGLPMKFDRSKPEIWAKQYAVRKVAKALATSRLKRFIDGMLPLVIDGTGHRVDKVISQKRALEEIGYDVHMIFVNTSLEVAQERNRLRDRTLEPEDVEKLWKEVQSNLGKFQSEFKSGFHIIDNNEILQGQDLKQFQDRMFKLGKKILESPLQNRKGQAVIAAMDLLKAKTLEDLGNKVEELDIVA